MRCQPGLRIPTNGIKTRNRLLLSGCPQKLRTIPASSPVSFNTPASEYPSTVLSPVYGELEVGGGATGSTFSSKEKWLFCQHKTGGHKEGEGIGGADDTYAWDINLIYPYHNTDDGKPVYAIAPGTVTQTYGERSNTDGTYGQDLIEHEYNKDKWWSGYLHLKDIQVKRGEKVTSDTIIGYISDVTGSSTPITSHLHFAVYTGSNELNSLKSFDATITPRLPSTYKEFSPGNRSESSPEIISDRSPEFSWPAVPGADYYGLYLSEEPYGAENKIFWSDEYGDGKQIVKSSFSLPAEYTLDPGVTYRWNMRVHTPEKGWGDFNDRRYFRVADAVPNPDKPGVDLFKPAITVIKKGESVSFEYQVSAPAGLKQVELWRTDTENVWPTDPAGYVKSTTLQERLQKERLKTHLHLQGFTAVWHPCCGYQR